MGLPILAWLTVLIARLRLSAPVAWVLLILMWGLFLVPVTSQLYWIFVEEPARIKNGLPIE